MKPNSEKMKKYQNFAKFLAVVSFAICVAITSAQAQVMSQEEWNKKLQELRRVEDSDLKMSIEELKKKYPIGKKLKNATQLQQFFSSWIEEKFGDFSYCIGAECVEETCAPAPEKLICAFSEKKGNDEALQFSVNDFAEKEVKSVFLNFDRVVPIKGLLKDYRELQFIFATYYYFYQKPISVLSEKEKKLAAFIFSDKIIEKVILNPDVIRSVVNEDLYAGYEAASKGCEVTRVVLPYKSEAYQKFAQEYLKRRNSRSLDQKENPRKCLNPLLVK